MERAARLTGNPPPRRAGLAVTLAAAQRREEAEAIYQELQHASHTEFVSALDLALLATHLGRNDEAFEWMQRACDQRAPWLSHLKADPVWDPIRDDERFVTLTQRIGLL
jgi:hypothetical protein